MVVSSDFLSQLSDTWTLLLTRLIHTRQRRSSSFFSPGERKIPPATTYSQMITFKFSTEPHYTLTHQSRARQGGKLKANRWIIKEEKILRSTVVFNHQHPMRRHTHTAGFVATAAGRLICCDMVWHQSNRFKI